jgi:type I restriction enzyme, S subunit
MSATVKPGYKQTEVGVIPEEWAAAKAGDVCGCIVPGRNKPQLFDGDIPWITTPDLENGRLVTTSRLGLCISKEEAKSVGSKIVPPGSVLMSCAGELGIVAMTKNEIVVNQQLHVFIPTGRIDAVFLLNALAYRKGQIENIGTKTAVPYLNKSACNSVLVPLPPPPEQRAIAEALSDVDGLLGGLDRLIAKKRDLKQAAMQQLLTGQTRLPGFQGEWEVKRLGEVLKVRHGKSQHGIAAPDGKYPILASGGEIGRTNAFIYDQPSVLIGRKGTIDAPQYVDTPFWTVDTLFFTEISSEADAKFVFYKFTMIRWRSYNEASGVPSLNAKTIENIEVTMPPQPEQTAIAEVLSEMDGELAVLEQRREKTRALKQAMMQELLTGRTRLV